MARGPYRDLDAAPFARRRAPALAHDAHRLTNELRGDAIHQDDTVGDPPRQLQHPWTRRRNIDRHRRPQMAELGRLAEGGSPSAELCKRGECRSRYRGVT